MKKTVYICVIAVLVIQVVLSLLRVLGVIGWRWLWVLTPLWALIVAALFYGLFLSVQKKSSGREDLPDEKDSDKQ